MLPSFISSKLAYKILVVGKSINFMKACMQHGGRDEQVREGRGKEKGKGKDRRNMRGGGNLPPVTMREALGEGSPDSDAVAETKEEIDEGGGTQVVLRESNKGQEEVLGGNKIEEEEEEDEEVYADSSILLSEDFEASLRDVCHSYGDEVALSAQVHAIAEVIETRLLNMVRRLGWRVVYWSYLLSYHYV